MSALDLVIVAGAGLCFAAVGLLLFALLGRRGGGATIGFRGLEVRVQSASLVVFLAGAAMVASPVWVPGGGGSGASLADPGFWGKYCVRQFAGSVSSCSDSLRTCERQARWLREMTAKLPVAPAACIENPGSLYCSVSAPGGEVPHEYCYVTVAYCEQMRARSGSTPCARKDAPPGVIARGFWRWVRGVRANEPAGAASCVADASGEIFECFDTTSECGREAKDRWQSKYEILRDLRGVDVQTDLSAAETLRCVEKPERIYCATMRRRSTAGDWGDRCFDTREHCRAAAERRGEVVVPVDACAERAANQ